MTTRTPLSPRSLPLSRLRNFGIIAHVDAGKTTLTERVLVACGAIRKAGEVHHGTTTTDHHPLERQKGITIGSAAVRCTYGDAELQLIDTPGHVDFAIEVERSLRVLDGAVVVLDAVAGVEPQTESVWHKAERFALPRIVFVNKLDRAGADLEMCVRQLRERLGARPLVVQAPVVEGGVVTGVRGIVGADADAVVRAAVVDVLAGVDEAVFNVVAAGGVVDDATVVAAIRRATLAGALVPVLMGAALKELGIGPLLDAVVAFLPSPQDVLEREGVDVDGIDGVDAQALAFKVVHDKYGPTTLVRVYRGALQKGDALVALSTGARVRVGRLGRAFAGQFEDVDVAVTGDIVGLIGASLRTGETLATDPRATPLFGVETPAPVMTVALVPKTRDDRERLGPALARLLNEDPSLVLATDEETGETTLSGQGELHLEVTLLKLASDHGVDVVAGAPRVAYKETPSSRVEHTLTWAKQSGGPGQWARLRLAVGPAPRGQGLVVTDATSGGVVPKEFLPAIHDGIKEALQAGPRGHVVVDVDVAIVDGMTHVSDSSPIAFHLCARTLVKEALAQAKTTLLEPIVQVDVTVPEDRVGDVVSDFAKRRGVVRGIDVAGSARAVIAEVPLAALFGYASALRSLSQGRASFTTTPRGLAEVG
jgi:elongation factor G